MPIQNTKPYYHPPPIRYEPARRPIQYPYLYDEINWMEYWAFLLP